MKKGFSIKISEQNVDVKSFISEDYDNLYLKTASFDFLFEGVLLNRKKLLNEFALKDFETLIGELYFLKKENIIKEFEGEFRGFIFDKVQQKLFVFTNATSTQRVFYGKFNDEIFIDSSLVRFNETLKNSGIKPKPNLESIYQFLCFSNLPENKTPIEGIAKIFDGHYLEIDCNKWTISEKQYFDLSKISTFSRTKDAAIDKIHEVFRDSILLEYQKDTELGKNHLALLSGGLDSRVAMMYAIQEKVKPENALCFSQSGYFDHTISEKIAEDFDVHYEFVPLDGGKFLKKIDELTELSEGMVFYTGGIHVKHAVEQMQYENFALFHSGQIGDGVLGGFNTVPYRKKPSYFKIAENQKFFPKVQFSLDEILKKYETEELFLLRNVAYNRTVLGAHVFQQKRYQTSSFMSKDFLQLAISLPEEWKFNHRFYLEWIQKHCKEATKYRWERTLLKPDANWKTSFGDKFVKRSFKLLNEKILKTPQNSSMYPYQYYFDNDTEIQNYYKNYFEDNIHRIEDYKELESDVKELFQSENFYSKSQSVNILAIFKLFFKVKSLSEFLRNFFQNKGQHVFISLLIAKICAFLGSLFIIRILPESDFGTMSIVASVFAIFTPFSGFGSHQSLLRFGSLNDNVLEKRSLANFLMLKGLGYQILLSVLFFLVSIFYVSRYEYILYIFIFFAIRLIGFYFFNYIQSELRIFGNNREFASVNNVVNISGVLLLLILSYFFGLKGYLIAIAFTPFISLLWFKKENLKPITENFSFNKKEIWNYGLHSSGTALLSDALFSADVLLLSFLMNETAVANYKVAILIPANITFLALTFMQSDFPMLAKNYQNRNFLRNYIKNYYKIFIPISALIFLIGVIFKSEILHLFFSAKYSDNSMVFMILLGGFCLNMLFRNLYGNLLSAVGKMKINTLISALTLILIFGFSFLFVPKFGIDGMGISLSFTLLLNGLLLMISFLYYLKNLK